MRVNEMRVHEKTAIRLSQMNFARPCGGKESSISIIHREINVTESIYPKTGQPM